MKSEITQKRLQELLDYNESSGEFFWKRTMGGKAKSGDRAGMKLPKGYIFLKVDQVNYLAHRLVWLYFYGVMPVKLIDNINGRRDDNRISNLREADHSLNGQNMRSARSDNKSGLLGVRLAGNRFYAVIRPHKGAKQISLGGFGSAVEAHAAYLKAKRRFHQGCSI